MEYGIEFAKRKSSAKRREIHLDKPGWAVLPSRRGCDGRHVSRACAQEVRGCLFQEMPVLRKRRKRFDSKFVLGGKNEEILVSFAVTGVDRGLQHVSDGR
ncbi:MAG: hypothetical protein GXY72_10870 [Deltaproteobacteria bacterium]|jgi:hypothetical protein|nr:hypothetical protein [Deltaproteobacteria bacterium]